MKSEEIQTDFDEILRVQQTQHGPILHIYKKIKITTKNGEILNKGLSPRQLHFIKQYG